MNVAVIKTKAEMALFEQFDGVSARLPGNSAVTKLRRAAIGRFAALGLPHRRIEDWKYTDLRTILKDAAPLATGGYQGEMHHFVEYAVGDSLQQTDRGGDWSLFADGKRVTANGALSSQTQIGAVTLAAALADPPAWLAAELERISKIDGDGVLALNTAYMTDGMVLDIKDGADVVVPLHLIFVAGRLRDEDPAVLKTVVTRNIIRVGRNAKLTLVESHNGTNVYPRNTNTLTQIIAGDGAEIQHLKFAAPAAGETHLAHWVVRLGAGATYRPVQMNAGLGVIRNQLTVTFDGPHSTIDLAALTLAREAGHSDTTMVIDHAVPQCTSRELYKCVLDNRARAVFQGKVIVQPGAQKTDGKQMARALLLSPDAEFDSKPELEIYADDVVCGHGTTSMELDEDLLFYCQSRGIPTAEARTLLIESFIGEVIDKVEDETLREILMAKARAWLSGTNA